MNLTQVQLAKQLGVSQRTVSNAFLPHAAISARTRQRVAAAAQKLGYRPNTSARAIRQGCFNAITLLMSADPYRSELPKFMFYGIQAAARAADVAVHLNIVPDDELGEENFVPKALREWQSDGLLINYHKSLPEHLQQLIDRHGIPSVFLNLDADHDSVRPDDRGAGRAATEHLLALGHRRIWYVGYSYRRDKFHYSELERQDGYADAMLDAGLKPTCIDYYHPELGTRLLLDAWRRALIATDRPTAVVCYANDLDLSVVHHAATLAGLIVPRDLSLVTFDGSPAVGAIGIDTWLVPEAEVGRIGFKMLQQKIRQPKRMLAGRKVPFTHEPGESVAPPSVVDPSARTTWRSQP